MNWVLFFDGDCGFCNTTVRWVSRFDPQGRIFFAPLQGKLSREKGFTRHAAKVGGSMVVLREADGKVFLKSDGWIELARALGGGWKLFTLCRFVPERLRDFIYQLIADHRHHLSGKIPNCQLPDDRLRERLLE